MRTRRALTWCASAALLAATAGCTAASSSQTVSGKTLVIYVSVPVSAAQSREQQDILYAEELAFNQLQSSVSSFKLRLMKVPPTTGVIAKLSDNARAAIVNTSTIAYLGEIAPGNSADSIGITNDQDVLQVSPTDTSAALTQSTPAVSSSPNKYYEQLSTFGRTFARVAPTTGVEASAVINEMKRLSVKSVYVTGDNNDYGQTIKQEVTSDSSPAITVQPAGSKADAVFYGGSSPAAAASAYSANGNPKAKLFVPSAMEASVTQIQGVPGKNLIVSAPGFLPKALNPMAKKFVSDFRKTYGHTPAGQAIFGYAAMSAVITVLSQAGPSANNRATVAKRFLAISNMPSVLGTFSINGSGDTSLSAIVFSHVVAGKLVPFKAA